jgi:hypothetical protein
VGDGVVDETERRVRTRVRGGHQLVMERCGLGFCPACANALGVGVGAQWRVGHGWLTWQGVAFILVVVVVIWVNALASRGKPKKVK